MKNVKRVVAGWVFAVAGMVPGLAAAGITYYHNDIAGSPVVATNESGQVVWRESYRPYGERTVNSAAALPNKVWFTSRRQDAETGLVYMGARYYDPVVGRFVSKDPVGFDEKNLHSFNRYAYANNNPYKFRDPDGRAGVLIAAEAGLLLGGAAFISQPRDTQQRQLKSLIQGIQSLFGPLLNEGQQSDSREPSKGASNGDKETGSYTNTHESGKKYHGKGDRARSQQSGKDKEKESGDRHVATDWTPSSDDREAFKDEARRIQEDRGVSNPDNFNKINSPGKKYLD